MTDPAAYLGSLALAWKEGVAGAEPHADRLLETLQRLRRDGDELRGAALAFVRTGALDPMAAESIVRPVAEVYIAKVWSAFRLAAEAAGIELPDPEYSLPESVIEDRSWLAP